MRKDTLFKMIYFMIQGRSGREVAAELVWLTKQGRATMGSDRMGRVKSIKVK